MPNKYKGSSFDSFLRDEGFEWDVLPDCECEPCTRRRIRQNKNIPQQDLLELLDADRACQKNNLQSSCRIIDKEPKSWYLINVLYTEVNKLAASIEDDDLLAAKVADYEYKIDVLFEHIEAIDNDKK